MKTTEIESGGYKVTLKPNSSKASDEDLYIDVTGAGFNNFGWAGVTGRDKIEEFVYAAAVHGGLIEDGEELVLRKKAEIPTENGAYLFKVTVGGAESGRVVILVDGVFLSERRMDDEKVTDVTELVTRTTRDGSGSLTRLVPML